MINLMVGNNWDFKLLQGIIDLNKIYFHNDIQVTELYGSLLNNPIGTARPDYRVQNYDDCYFQRFIQLAHDNNILINYTLNIPCFGSLEDLKTKEPEIVQFLKHLQKVGVDRITISHPLIMEFVMKYTNMPIEVSTIFEIDSLQKLYHLKNYNSYNINKICMKHAMNRNFKFLKRFCEESKKLNIDIELIVNEFCILDCIDRTACYNLHGHTHDKTMKKYYGFYPMGKCIIQRWENPVEWIKASFILPQWMEFYQNTCDISNFKITGRTHFTSYILWVTEQYMKKNYEGNLLDLWGHLENIGKEEHNYKEPSYVIDIKDSKLNTFEFIKEIYDKNINCSMDCNITCSLCYTIIREMFV